MRRLLSLAAFYVGWITCVAGAAAGRPWLGPMVVTTMLALRLAFAAAPKTEVGLIVVLGACGFVLESLFAFLGLYTYTADSTWLCPPWMVALWMMFATALQESPRWLSQHLGVAALAGALVGPLSYLAGARLGAITLPDLNLSILGLALAWGAILPSLLWMQERMRRKTALTIGWTIG